MRSLHAPLLIVLGLSSVACSLLISAEADPLPCSQEGRRGPPACDEGFSCQAGLCRLRASAFGGESGAGASFPGDAQGGDRGSGGANSAGADGAGAEGGLGGVGGQRDAGADTKLR